MDLHYNLKIRNVEQETLPSWRVSSTDFQGDCHQADWKKSHHPTCNSPFSHRGILGPIAHLSDYTTLALSEEASPCWGFIVVVVAVAFVVVTAAYFLSIC